MAKKFSETFSFRDREQAVFTPTAADEVAKRTVNDGRSSTPNVAQIFAMFNPLSMPLKKWTRMFELHIPVGDVERGIYFINETFMQFYIRINSVYPAFDVEVVENNILLLNSGTALKLNVPPIINPIPITDTFLGIN